MKCALRTAILTLAALLGLSVAPSAGSAQHRRQQDIETVTLTRLEEPAHYIHIVARGYGYVNRWEIEGAVFGTETKVLALTVFPDGKGFSGLLPPEVPEGAKLSVVVKENTYLWTDHYYHDKDVRGAARRSLEEREDCALPVVPGRSIGPVKLGMTVAQIERLGAKRHPDLATWFELGRMFIIVKDGKVITIALTKGTACLVEGGRKRKIDLEIELPYADCKSDHPGTVIIGHASLACGNRGVALTPTHGHGEDFPEISVYRPRTANPQSVADGKAVAPHP
jgi:hypothetical protein